MTCRRVEPLEKLSHFSVIFASQETTCHTFAYVFPTLVLCCTIHTILKDNWGRGGGGVCVQGRIWAEGRGGGSLGSQTVKWATRTCACCSGLRLDLSVPRLSAVRPGSTGYKATASAGPSGWCFFWADPWHTYPPLARTGRHTHRHTVEVSWGSFGVSWG